jgi:hypothetical protein
VTDSKGTFTFRGIKPPDAKATLKVRSTQLLNSGFDLPAQAGQSVQVRSQQLRNYNPNACPEKDKLLALYSSAKIIRQMYLMAQNDYQKLSTAIEDKFQKKSSGRAMARATSQSQLYFDFSAKLPDRQLLCSKTAAGACTFTDLRSIVRRMRAAGMHVRRESLLFNRQMRLKNFRSEAESTKRIRRIRQIHARAESHMSKLARSTFECP